MKKIIISMLIIGCLLTTSIAPMNAFCIKIKKTTEVSEIEPSSRMMLYKYSVDQKIGSMYRQSKTTSKNDSNPELLWNNSDDVGLCYFTPIFSSDVNSDGVPDVLVNHSALDGRTGELIWHTSTGKACGVGDINNDGKDEVFTRDEGLYSSDYSYLYCLNGSNGIILWQLCLNCTIIYDIAVGNLTGDATNEVIVPTGDWVTHNNQYVYCLDGITGNIIWDKFTINRAICAKIADVNNDGKNEALVSNWERRLYCLDGNGSVIWEIYNVDSGDYRTICIGDLNQDPYKEIILESGCGVRCISGNNGSNIWSWDPEPDGGWTGSKQSMIIADMIPGIPGNEVIAGGVCGLYCLRGGDTVPPNEREIWHAGISNGILPHIVMSADIGDLDKDGLLDVAAITTWYGNVYAIDGQAGTRLWKYENCGTENFHAIIVTDVTGDNYPEAIAKDDSFVCALKSNSTPNNCPPYKPNIDGPTIGKIGEIYTYTAVTIDPEGDNISYLFDWGDGTNSGWTQFIPSGISINASHNWSENGSYKVKVKAKDVNGSESGWSNVLMMVIGNVPPNAPTINGPPSGRARVKYEYMFVTTDPNGDDVYYYIDWGDNINSEWIGPYHSGEEITMNHTWSRLCLKSIPPRQSF